MTTSSTLMLIAVYAVSLDVPARGQTLEPGRWAGTISPPSGGTFEIWYEVAGAGDSLSVTMYIPQPNGANEIPLENLELEDDGSIAFGYRGGDIRCRLPPSLPVGYAGECTSATRPGTARLTMTPPRREKE